MLRIVHLSDLHLGANEHRSGSEVVLGEDPRARHWRVGHQQPDVGVAAGLDARADAGGAQPFTSVSVCSEGGKVVRRISRSQLSTLNHSPHYAPVQPWLSVWRRW